MPLYYLWSIGCQMNDADSRRLAEKLESRSFCPTRRPKEADVLVLNTCVVRQRAEDKVVGRLSSLCALKREPKRRALLVMGCFVGDLAALEARYPFVDGFFAPSDISGVVEFVDDWVAQPEQEGQVDGHPRPYAQVAEMVPISYGCDHRCTYCIVAIRRGRQKSRPVSEVVSEARDLVHRGAREITLLGQNVDAYGADLPEQPDLADVLEAVHDIDKLWRIRFLTSHPRDMALRIIETVAALPKVCKCWELAVQSGDNEVLRRMGRGYRIERFRELVAELRRLTPGCAVNTDIIVGFPGESSEQFTRTLDLVREVRFDIVHVAAYSPRPGTVAAGMDDDVPPAEKIRRRQAVEEAQECIATEMNAEQLGRTVEVLVDGRQRGRWRGRTTTNKLVFFESDDDWLGQLARVRITWTGPWSMLGSGKLDRRPVPVRAVHACHRSRAAEPGVVVSAPHPDLGGCGRPT